MTDTPDARAIEALLRADLEHAGELGFTGKLCIHPGQVGRMIDRPVELRARAVLARAGKLP
ncbi:hypothetical protein [Amycolatopsis kentuckyensis]|uniref:hypothetical protein n=1 Tax=Amycolatopsis kentuckyensis TaxID=218823 RepID=UPI003562FA1F